MPARRLLASLLLTPALAHAGFEAPWPQSLFDALLPEELPALTAPEYFTPLDVARQQVRAGRYKLALFTLYPLAESAEKLELRGETLLRLGRGAEAMRWLEKSRLRGQPAGERLLACCEAALGNRAAATTRLRELLDRQPDNVEARALLGQLLEEQGDPAAAAAAYAWVTDERHGFVAAWQQGKYDFFGDPDRVLAIAQCLDREAYLTSRYARDRRLHDVILSMYVRVYDVMDRGNPEARVLAGRFFLAHDDPEKAMGEFSAALRTNPNHAEGLLGVGLISSEHLDFSRAEMAAATMRQVDPDSREAVMLEVESLLAQRMPEQALALSRGLVVGRSPGEVGVKAASLHAAALALSWQKAELAEWLKKVEPAYPNAGAVYYAVGEHYSAMRQYEDSAVMLQKAVTLAPWMTEARNALGLLYTQSGDEQAARAALEAARQLDPFNLRTTNYLRLLDELESFAKVESDHFIVLHDKRSEPFLAGEMLAYMESHYARMSRLYQHEPREKTLIEVFPSHDRFSVRTTGSRWIATIGASTGRVIALVTPRKSDETMGLYEWGEVLRHEFTHTLTLSATGNRIPHWLTEGLAVGEEGAPIRADIAPILAKATRDGTLFTLDNITWGFARPRKPHDRSMAYAQSYLMCRYIRETFGDGAIGILLAAVRDNVPEKEAIRTRLKTEPAVFESGFRAWMQKESIAWGYDVEAKSKYDAAVRRGEDLIADDKHVEAIEAWKQATSIRPLEPLPHQRLAGLYLSRAGRDPMAAAGHLEFLDRQEIKSARYAKRLMKLYDSEPPKAIEAGRRASRTDPWDADTRDQLASLYERTGNAAAASEQRRIAATIRENAGKVTGRHTEPNTP